MSIFSEIRTKKPKRNRFNLSHNVLTTAKAGQLIPFFCQPVYPGDSAKMTSEILMRMTPLRAPMFQNMNLYTHFFFVPYRLIWDKWKEFITGGESGKEQIPFPRYHFQVDNTTPADKKNLSWILTGSGSLCDYLGFQNKYTQRMYETQGNMDYYVNALPFRAYQLIYNEYYRDQNLDQEINIDKDSSGDILALHQGNADGREELFVIRQRAWSKDYFTSALPWAQRGDDVLLPIQQELQLKNRDGSNYVETSDINVVSSNNGLVGEYLQSGGTIDGSHKSDYELMLVDDFAKLTSYSPDGNGTSNPYINLNEIYGDLKGASATTINELRRAIKTQEFLEVRARGGSRYIEQILSFFGVRSSDARLQRPEYLGGGKSPVVISDILQTSQTTETSAQATPSGHAVAVQKTHQFNRFFEEHGLVIGILSIMPKSMYMQGTNRALTKYVNTDYYWPQFAHLGEQEIKQGEIYLDPNDPAANDRTFGYTPRYAEYKFIPDTVHGDFRDSLNFWHMGRIFDNEPRLNTEFIHNVDSVERPFAVQDTEYDKFWIMVHNNLVMKRPMPRFGTPLL